MLLTAEQSKNCLFLLKAALKVQELKAFQGTKRRIVGAS